MAGDPLLEDEDELAGVFGEDLGAAVEARPVARIRKREFLPWHHPVKQIVRRQQWAELTGRLVRDRRAPRPKLQYFTLPGADLLDVQVLAEVCQPESVEIEYLGFNTAIAAGGPAPWAEIEASLRQAGLVSAGAQILSDRLEDIAKENSLAANALAWRPPFDVLNIDACDHLAFCPGNRDSNTFDAVKALLKHQINAREEWLLFITTRVDPELMGEPGEALKTAVNDNLQHPVRGFGEALALALEANEAEIERAVADAWGTKSEVFLRMYSIGLGKFLLQFFHAQPNHPANVELASACAYRVHDDVPDMLSLAFRITPDPARVFEPAVQQIAPANELEPLRACRLAQRAIRLRDLDRELAAGGNHIGIAVQETISLLSRSGYEIAEYRNWLANHDRRPYLIDEAVGA